MCAHSLTVIYISPSCAMGGVFKVGGRQGDAPAEPKMSTARQEPRPPDLIFLSELVPMRSINFHPEHRMRVGVGLIYRAERLLIRSTPYSLQQTAALLVSGDFIAHSGGGAAEP